MSLSISAAIVSATPSIPVAVPQLNLVKGAVVAAVWRLEIFRLRLAIDHLSSKHFRQEVEVKIVCVVVWLRHLA